MITHHLALTGLGLSLVLSACSGGGGLDRAFEPEHVHGLAQEPDSGRLLIATHDGLFALEEGADAPTPVNDLTTDLMGFTVAESGDFYASGHPGQGEEGPSALGLVTSSDGGDSFSEVSLGGEADFHALEATPTTVYGVDAGTRLMRSADAGQTWEELTLPRPVADIAADPASDAVLATSEVGLLRSEDGGESFTLDEAAPTMLLVDWSDQGRLVGVDPSGEVFTATDSGSWAAQASTAPPQALTTTANGSIYVATEGSLLRSEDEGASFETVTDW